MTFLLEISSSEGLLFLISGCLAIAAVTFLVMCVCGKAHKYVQIHVFMGQMEVYMGLLFHEALLSMLHK